MNSGIIKKGKKWSSYNNFSGIKNHVEWQKREKSAKAVQSRCYAEFSLDIIMQSFFEPKSKVHSEMSSQNYGISFRRNRLIFSEWVSIRFVFHRGDGCRFPVRSSQFQCYGSILILNGCSEHVFLQMHLNSASGLGISWIFVTIQCTSFE